MTISIYSVTSIILTFAVGIAYVNHRYVKMQPTIAVMFASLLLSLVLILLSSLGLNGVMTELKLIISRLNFRDLMLNGMLSFLLFAGALTVDLKYLLSRRWEIGILATTGTLISTFLIATAMYYILALLGLQLGYIYCLLFGALISPTDPIAVLAMCKELNAPKKLSVSIAGESLFNDGVGIVIFLSIYQLAFGGGDITVTSVSILFIRESIGGIAYGILLGLLSYWLIKPIDDHKVEILITLAVTTGGYLLAQSLQVSGPLAMVVAGIFLGNTGENFRMSKKMSDYLFDFWELVDEILNAILFLLIGFEILLIPLKQYLLASIIAIPVVLAVRFLIVGLPFSFFKIWRRYNPHIIKIMTLGGLRGGLAVALALSLPNGKYRELILAMTYTVVVFSILVQGTTVKSLVKMSKSPSQRQKP